jgi:molybdopterin-guanine dinucleotide biosynthesis protein A
MLSTTVADGVLAGVILAGGRSRRMGGAVKALLNLGDRPLLRHVMDRVNPQVDRLLLSVERHSEAFDAFGLPQVVDPEPDGGPLGGLLSALRVMGPGHDWMLLVPCDAPFVPSDLAAKLLACALASTRPGAVVCYESEIQPTFSIWNRNVLPRLEQAVLEEGMAGLKQFLSVKKLAELDWPRSKPSPFFNINDRDALLKAGRLMDQQRSEPTFLTGRKPCSA